MNKIRPIAIYLPQFHPIPENDEWWGKGFTEWTNVAKAKPLFEGHRQPNLPADLGFYDLRVPEVREEQAKLAKEHGIYGFCYYHYWFKGKRILERPFQEVFETGKPDFPFMLCWANENWTKVWDGGENNILLEQQYSEEDYLNHINHLIPYLQDKRYIRIDNKPVIAIYRSAIIPNVEKLLNIWRAKAAEYDLELYMIRFESLGDSGYGHMSKGFDAAAEFQPHTGNHAMPTSLAIKTLKDEITVKTISRSIRYRLRKIQKNLYIDKAEGSIVNYADLVQNELNLLEQVKQSYKLYPAVCAGFDNTPRRKERYSILLDSTPELFEKWMKEEVKAFQPYSDQENLFFINAWNEWAEGNFIEPSAFWGKKYLEAVKNVFKIKSYC